MWRSRLFWSSPFTGALEDAEVIGRSPSSQVACNSGEGSGCAQPGTASALGWTTLLVLALCSPVLSPINKPVRGLSFFKYKTARHGCYKN